MYNGAKIGNLIKKSAICKNWFYNEMNFLLVFNI